MPILRRDGSREEAGQALPLALLLVVVLLISVALLTGTARRDLSRSGSGRVGLQLLNAARAGLAQARCATWDAAVAAGADADPARTRAFLDGLGLSAGERRWLQGEALVAAPPAGGALRLRSEAGLRATPALTVQVELERRDVGQTTFLLFTAEASAGGGERRTAEVVLRLGHPPYEGLGFALLARNASCIFCHTRIDDVRRQYASAGGPVPRVKVATLEALSLRGNCDSLLAGTLYVRGHLLNQAGVELPAPIGGAAGLQAETLDARDGTIVGHPLVDLVDGTPSRTPFASFYKHYPQDPAGQFDGAVPGSFPPVVPDLDRDGSIGAAEWAARVAGSTGRVTGGVIVTVPRGATWSGPALPGSGAAPELRSATPATHAILVGTPASPLRIEGEVAIDGDALVSGTVAGSGVLLVRGNLYVVGDLTYADGADASGARTFGLGGDGGENAIAWAAGGSILHGPYNTDKDGTPVSDVTLDGFTGQQLALFNRMEWTRAQPWFDPRRGLPSATDTGIPNSAWDPAHVPRYYVLAPGAQPQMFLGGRWDNARQAWVGKEKGTPDTVIDLTGKVAGRDYSLRPLDPEGGWLAPDTLRALHAATDAARIPGPYRLDGLYYTPNALFLMARRGSSAGGQVVVNGAIVAADAGVLVPGPAREDGPGLQLNYDARTARLLRLEQAEGRLQPFALLRRER